MGSYMKHLHDHKSAIRLYLIGILFFAASAITGILLGATSLSPMELLEGILNMGAGGPAATIVRYVRFPRVAAGLLCGSALAVAGAVIQGVLANRLASPSIIGVNSGAGLAVTVCCAIGVTGGWRLSLFAFIGAFAAVMVVSMGAKKWGASRGTVILMGVAMNSLLGAFSDGITAVIPDVSMIRNDFRLGDLSGVTYAKLIPAAVVILSVMLVLHTLTNELDVLALGDETAKSLGMNTSAMRVLFLILAALLSGAAVSMAGLLSFVGLLVPHAIRKIAGNETRHLIPLCALFGGGFVALCDTFARSIFAPYELPVGIIMAFLGAPFFLALLLRKGGSHA